MLRTLMEQSPNGSWIQSPTRSLLCFCPDIDSYHSTPPVVTALNASLTQIIVSLACRSVSVYVSAVLDARQRHGMNDEQLVWFVVVSHAFLF